VDRLGPAESGEGQPAGSSRWIHDGEQRLLVGGGHD
jgi:hypothetical protein